MKKLSQNEMKAVKGGRFHFCSFKHVGCAFYAMGESGGKTYGFTMVYIDCMVDAGCRKG